MLQEEKIISIYLKELCENIHSDIKNFKGNFDLIYFHS